MAIGKNAIKRVENDGYSKVATSAPDMENSNVIANVDKQVVEKILAPIEEATPVAQPTPVKKSKRKAPAKKQSVERVQVGEEMPYYLL